MIFEHFFIECVESNIEEKKRSDKTTRIKKYKRKKYKNLKCFLIFTHIGHFKILQTLLANWDILNKTIKFYCK